jgi:peptidoglycan hydrolase-like protein with peptidoglycan-binding domain
LSKSNKKIKNKKMNKKYSYYSLLTEADDTLPPVTDDTLPPVTDDTLPPSDDTLPPVVKTKKTTPKTTTGTQCTSYSVCSSGTLKKCCKDSGASRTNPDTNGIIYKLQGVIGATQDGYFGIRTENALKQLRKTTTITVDDANKLISANNLVISATTKTPEEQKTFFDGLIKDKYIRDGNLLQINTPQITALDGRTIYGYAYVKKFEAVRDKNGNLISVGNVLVAPKSTEVIYSDETLIVFCKNEQYRKGRCKM